MKNIYVEIPKDLILLRKEKGFFSEEKLNHEYDLVKKVVDVVTQPMLKLITAIECGENSLIDITYMTEHLESVTTQKLKELNLPSDLADVVVVKKSNNGVSASMKVNDFFPELSRYGLYLQTKTAEKENKKQRTALTKELEDVSKNEIIGVPGVPGDKIAFKKVTEALSQNMLERAKIEKEQAVILRDKNYLTKLEGVQQVTKPQSGLKMR